MNKIMHQKLHGLILIILSIVGFKVIGIEDCGGFIVMLLVGVALFVYNKPLYD